MKYFMLLGAFGVLLFGAFSLPAQAAETSLQCSDGKCSYILLEPLPQFGKSDPLSKISRESDDFYTYLNSVVMTLIIIGAMLAVVRFSIGGIIFMTSDIAGKRSQAKSQMWACIWGLLLLVSAVLILSTINPDLVKIDFLTNLSDLGKSGKTPPPPCTGTRC
jgi:hypothetical protein